MFYRLLRFLLQAQDIPTDCVPSDLEGPTSCPGSALHAITAAFATQGYWVQADLLHFLDPTQAGNMELWAVLVYLVAAISGLVSMALGMPPRFYLWLFMGPGVYHWLTQDTYPVHGVRWYIGPEQRQEVRERAQREVWKLSEPGLNNTNFVRRNNEEGGGYEISSNRQPEGGDEGGRVRVSNLFQQYDRILSQLTEWFANWAGVYYLAARSSGDGDSLLPTESLEAESSTGKGGISERRAADQNFLLTNLKWTILEDITASKLHSGDLRESFINFMSSECGDAFANGIDEAKFIAASQAQGDNIPDSVFVSPPTLEVGPLDISLGAEQYTLVTQLLRNQSVPTPRSLQKLLTANNVGSFKGSLPQLFGNEEFLAVNNLDTIRCDQYLYFLTLGFRWEAGHIYYQMLTGLPAGITPGTLTYNLFYGWAIGQEDDVSLVEWVLGSGTGSGAMSTLSMGQQHDLLKDLILVHLYRNELATAPLPYTGRKSGSGEGVNYVETYQKTVGSKSKFGEVYTWALMMPYIQGVIMYMLAIAYPICCIFILIPGWHKLLFTWMSFWAWVKIWDIGFAIVIVLERTVWALIGNTPNAARLFSKTYSMQTFHKIGVSCPEGNFGIGSLGGVFDGAGPPNNLCAPGSIPQVFTGTTFGNGVGGGLGTVGGGGEWLQPTAFSSPPSWYDSMKVLDKALTLGANMDLDLSNSYYIYIMSALYFAVPAVMGQAVLGAKSGAASFVNNAIGGSASESGKMAGSGFSADMTNRARQASSVVGQSAYAKSMRAEGDAGGHVAAALAYGNNAMGADMAQGYASTAERGLSSQSRVASLGTDSLKDAMGATITGTQANLRTFGMFAGGGASGQGSGTGDQKVSPNAIKALQNRFGQSSAIGAAASKGFGALEAQFGAVGANGSAAANEVNRVRQAGYEGQQNARHIDAFTAGQHAKGYNAAASKQQSAGEFKAREAEWSAKRDFANQASGNLAAMGVSAGSLDPGAKPTNMEGMAMTGALGRDAKTAAEHSDPMRGMFFSQVDTARKDLTGQYGAAATTGMYKTADRDEARGAMLGAAGTHVANSASVGGAFGWTDKRGPFSSVDGFSDSSMAGVSTSLAIGNSRPPAPPVDSAFSSIARPKEQADAVPR